MYLDRQFRAFWSVIPWTRVTTDIDRILVQPQPQLIPHDLYDKYDQYDTSNRFDPYQPIRYETIDINSWRRAYDTIEWLLETNSWRGTEKSVLFNSISVANYSKTIAEPKKYSKQATNRKFFSSIERTTQHRTYLPSLLIVFKAMKEERNSVDIFQHQRGFSDCTRLFLWERGANHHSQHCCSMHDYLVRQEPYLIHQQYHLGTLVYGPTRQS